MWEIAIEKNTSHPYKVILAFEDLNEEELKDVQAMLLSGQYRDQTAPIEILDEIVKHPIKQAANWDYISKNMPLLKTHLFRECRKRECDLSTVVRSSSNKDNDEITSRLQYGNVAVSNPSEATRPPRKPAGFPWLRSPN